MSSAKGYSLTVRDCLSTNFIRVSAEARPTQILKKATKKEADICAVFEGETFLGLVDLREIHPAFAQRIFADLLSHFPPFTGDFPHTFPLPEDLPVEEVSRIMDRYKTNVLPVQDANGRFLGVVTQESLLHALLQKHTRLLNLTEKVKDLVQEINSTLGLEPMLDIALRKTLKIIELESGWIFLLDAETGSFELTAYMNLPAKYLENDKAAMREIFRCQRYFLETWQNSDPARPAPPEIQGAEKSASEEFSRSGATNFRSTLQKKPSIVCLDCERSKKYGTGFKFHLCVPLISPNVSARETHQSWGQLQGIMNLACRTPRDLLSEELNLLVTIGESLGTAIMNARSYHALAIERERLTRWSERLIELHKASKTLLQILGNTVLEEKLLQKGVEALCHLVEARYGAIGIVGEEGKLVKFVHTGLTDEEKALLTEPPEGRGILGLIVKENQVLRLTDLTQHPQFYGFPAHHPVMKTFLGVPISIDGEVYGRIYLAEKGDGKPFTEEDEKLALTMANSLAVAISNAHLLEKLKASEEKYRSLFENSLDAVFISAPGGRFIDVNPAAVELFGYASKEELLQVGLRKELCFSPENWETVKRILTDQGFVKNFELKLKRKDGKVIDVLISATAIYDTSGKVIGYRGILRDITERKHLEEQIRQAQKMETVGTLAGGIAHDFNNLLTVILGNASLALERLKPDNPGYQELLQIERAALHGGDLTTQLLSFSRRQMLKPKVLNPNKTIAELSRMLRRLIGENIVLKTDLAPNLAPVWADPSQFQQILMNLCVNARDAMPRGGTLTLITRNVTGSSLIPVFEADRQMTSEDSLPHSENYVKITVADTGIGMDKETQARIFEPFFTTKEVGKGTGLGLSVVYGIVKQHQGHIEVFSEVGKGTTFNIYLPVAPEAKIARKTGKKGSSFAGKGKTVLVVEDDDDVRNVTVRILKELDYKVLATHEGKKGMDFLEKEGKKVNLVILDVVLPELSGPEIYKKMRAIKPDLPVIFVTGYDLKAEINELIRSGSSRITVLPKPYTKESLIEKIHEILES